jgi:hypothetical protein
MVNLLYSFLFTFIFIDPQNVTSETMGQKNINKYIIYIRKTKETKKSFKSTTVEEDTIIQIH